MRRSQAGASLSEVLVTTGVAGLTAVLAFGIYARGSAAYRVQARSVVLEQRLRAALEVVARDLRQAGYLWADGPPVELDGGTLLARYADPVAPEAGQPGLAVDADGRACAFSGDAAAACPDLAWASGRVRLARLVTHRYRLVGDLLQTSTGGDDWTPLAEGIREFRVALEGAIARVTLRGHDDDLERTVATSVRLRNVTGGAP